MVARVNSAEGGSNGVAVTTANSGGTSGDKWDSVYIPTGGSLTFATAAAYKGSRGYRAVFGPEGSADGPNLRWSLQGWTQVRHRFYVRLPAYPSQSAILAAVSNRADGNFVAQVIVSETGRLLLTNNVDKVLFTSAASLPLNTWVRVEWIAAPGTKSSNGTLRVGYGTADGALVESFASTAANVGISGLGSLYVGKLSGVWSASVDFDDLAADDQSSTTFLGVSAASGTPVVVDPTPPPLPAAVEVSPVQLRDAIRSSVAIWYTVDASFQGAPVEGATDLRPTGGSITDTSKPGVRRTLNLDLPPTPGLFDLLSPVGTTLTVTAHVRLTDRSVIDVPMGVFDVDSQKISEGGGGISLTAPDLWVRIQRARFPGPRSITADPGLLATDILVQLIQEALPTGTSVAVTATSRASIPALTWEKDRDKAIIDLATSIGAWVYFDRTGTPTIADIPTVGTTADWLVDASTSGVLIELDRERLRTNTYNLVVVSSSATDGEAFPTQYVWDNDPNSPTYAGPDPIGSPQSAGPFGVVTYFYDTPLPLDPGGAWRTGVSILSRVSGLASQVSISQVPNPAVDALHTIDVLPPREQFNASRVLERHMVDTVTHPLTVGSPQQIDGRSTRYEVIAGGS